MLSAIHFVQKLANLGSAEMNERSPKKEEVQVQRSQPIAIPGAVSAAQGSPDEKSGADSPPRGKFRKHKTLPAPKRFLWSPEHIERSLGIKWKPRRNSSPGRGSRPTSPQQQQHQHHRGSEPPLPQRHVEREGLLKPKGLDFGTAPVTQPLLAPIVEKPAEVPVAGLSRPEESVIPKHVEAAQPTQAALPVEPQQVVASNHATAIVQAPVSTMAAAAPATLPPSPISNITNGLKPNVNPRDSVCSVPPSASVKALAGAGWDPHSPVSTVSTLSTATSVSGISASVCETVSNASISSSTDESLSRRTSMIMLSRPGSQLAERRGSQNEVKTAATSLPLIPTVTAASVLPLPLPIQQQPVFVAPVVEKETAPPKTPQQARPAPASSKVTPPLNLAAAFSLATAASIAPTPKPDEKEGGQLGQGSSASTGGSGSDDSDEDSSVVFHNAASPNPAQPTMDYLLQPIVQQQQSVIFHRQLQQQEQQPNSARSLKSALKETKSASGSQSARTEARPIQQAARDKSKPRHHSVISPNNQGNIILPGQTQPQAATLSLSFAQIVAQPRPGPGGVHARSPAPVPVPAKLPEKRGSNSKQVQQASALAAGPGSPLMPPRRLSGKAHADGRATPGSQPNSARGQRRPSETGLVQQQQQSQPQAQAQPQQQQQSHGGGKRRNRGLRWRSKSKTLPSPMHRTQPQDALEANVPQAVAARSPQSASSSGEKKKGQSTWTQGMISKALSRNGTQIVPIPPAELAASPNGQEQEQDSSLGLHRRMSRKSSAAADRERMLRDKEKGESEQEIAVKRGSSNANANAQLLYQHQFQHHGGATIHVHPAAASGPGNSHRRVSSANIVAAMNNPDS